VFLVLPAVFFAGLALIPIGLHLGKRRIGRDFDSTLIDRKAALRRLAWFFGLTSLFNVVIGTQFTYRAVEHMETPQFCGQTCHSMKPEFSAYLNSPHSSVECVECHVAPGATGWIASKTAGVRQLVETVRGNYSRPISGALASGRLIPASQTCERCHGSQQFGSVRLRLFITYADDEANTRAQTVLLMMVGGSKFGGIHGSHFGPGVRIRFIATDSQRQNIPWVEYQNTTSNTLKTFVSEGSNADSVKDLPEREMQCVDCHNRPAHTFETPDRAVDNALFLGEISTTLPYIKKEGMELLKATYSSNRQATQELPKALVSFYAQNYADLYAKGSADVQQAANALVAIYNSNVFPDMKVGWGTYPNNLGHTDFPGCFRCHDGSHIDGGGETITQDCNSCHEVLAMAEASPEILKTLGVESRISKVQKK
jgi:NapC/NirT cytochrome c family, N-terminal region